MKILTIAKNYPLLKLLLVTKVTVLFFLLNASTASANDKEADGLKAMITGKVISDSGVALSGVSVQVKGTNRGTTTDQQGEFSIDAATTDVLVFSYVGYETQEVPVGGNTQLTVTLITTRRELEQVVVIGYGTATKRDLTGSIAKVSGKEIADKPNVNPVASLQSKVAGLSVVNSAVPGAQPDIRIRGTISIGSVHPLYVVDGILNDNIDFINPNDIESIEILKDPSSLAIFGVRGAAGVIAVTTKKARAGQSFVNVNSTFGVKQLVDKIEFANRDEFLTLLTEEGQNRFNENASTTINDWLNSGNLENWTGNTDWIDAITRPGLFNTNNISVTGSTERNRFYMGVGYSIDEGIIEHVRYDKILLSINDEFKVNKAIKIGFNIAGTREKFPYDATGLLGSAKRVAPIVSADSRPTLTYLYGPDSSRYNLYSALPTIQNTVENPILTLENRWDKTRDYQYRAVGSVFAEITFLKNFNFRTTLYGDISNRTEQIYTPLIDAYVPSGANSVSGVSHIVTLTGVNQNDYNTKKYQSDYILTYKRNFGSHGLTVTAGWTTYYNWYSELKASVQQKAGGDPIPPDERFWYVSAGFGDPTTRRATSKQIESATLSGLFRVLYNYKGKYFINGSYRRDGSSQIYNPDSRWQNFWAVGAAWDISKENFMSNQNFFDYLKLKGSIGLLGNQNTLGRDYPYFPTLSAGSAVFGNNVSLAYTNDYRVDPGLKWETVLGKEIGLEMNAFQRRLFAEIVYYDKRTKDLLVLLRRSGELPTLSNFGEISNKGFEFTASWTQKFTRDLTLTVSANLTTYKNKVIQLTAPLYADEQYPNQTLEDFPISYFYGFVVDGIYQNQAEIDKAPFQGTGGPAMPGDFRYKDVSGPDGVPDGVIDDLDKTMIGNPTPDFAYGASIGLNYKGIDLGIDVGGVVGNEIYRYWNTSENVFSVYNYPKYLLDRWHGEGTSNSIPIINQTRKINRLPSSYGIESGTYFRIRNIQLGYNFKTDMLAKAYIKNLRIFVNVQNLVTIKNNLGYSPEFTGGQSNGTDAVSFGIDNGDARSAIPRVISGGINITF